MSTGAASASVMRLAASLICSAVETVFSTTMNSSPPIRTTMSSVRVVARMRCATALSSLSPVSWPRESLMCLKRSRSRNSTASMLPVRFASAIAPGRCAARKSRFGRPGELVVVGQMVEVLLLLEELRLHPPAHGDVAGRQRKEACVPDVEPIAADLHLEETSAAAALSGLDENPRRRFPQLRQQRLRRAAVVTEDLRQRHRSQLLQLVAEAALQSRVGVDDLQ